MLRWIFIPLYSYLLLLPLVGFIESIGGRGTVGANALNEYLIIVQLVIIANIFHIIRKRGFTKDSK